MTWSPNQAPTYAYGPFSTLPVALSSSAYAGGGVTANATKIYSADGTHRPAFGLIALQPVGTLSAGKFVLLTSATVGGATLTEIDEVAVASQSGYSSTASGLPITFARWAPGTPLILTETQDLYVASPVSQANPPIAYAAGKLF